MNQAELKTRIEHYKQALADGLITGHEYEGFMDALRRMTTLNYRSAGATRKPR
jgi:hypothetical protein